jgi:hypothetical protein
LTYFLASVDLPLLGVSLISVRRGMLQISPVVLSVASVIAVKRDVVGGHWNRCRLGFGGNQVVERVDRLISVKSVYRRFNFGGSRDAHDRDREIPVLRGALLRSRDEHGGALRGIERSAHPSPRPAGPKAKRATSECPVCWRGLAEHLRGLGYRLRCAGRGPLRLEGLRRGPN